MSEEQFTCENLDQRSYRDLQQLAKSFGLPSNVKKICLIQLIHAKKFLTPTQVAEIVKKVKQERKRMSQARKRSKRRHLQGAEISSTSQSQSPPKGATPKLPGHIVVCSPDIRHSVIKYPRASLLRPIIKKSLPSPQMNASDRVLRSFTMRPKSNLQNTILSLVEAKNPVSSKETMINILGQGGVYSKLNVRAKCMVRKQRPSIQSPSALLASPLRAQLMPIRNRMNICQNNPAKRQRVLSGIYPIATKETPKVSYEYVQSIGFRRSDGKLSKINALVQKTLNYEPAQNNYRSVEVTMQDLINSNIDTQNINPKFTVPEPYPNMSSVTEYAPNYDRQANQYEMPERNYVVYKEADDVSKSSVYYHKKIRAEQVRSQRMSVQRDGKEDQLPKINEVFSAVRDVHARNVTQPIYVQVSEESERILNYPLYAMKNTNNTTMLETLYNFKSQFLTNQPLLQVATTSSTKCVFSTPLIATPTPQQRPFSRPNKNENLWIIDTKKKNLNINFIVQTTSFLNNVIACERDNQTTVEPELPRIYDVFNWGDQDAVARRDYVNEPTEVFSTSGSSLDTSNAQAAESTVTIPEMVEDALEIISQDGDYMERIGMDIRVQCILCSWAGPRFILEYHIRKEHANQITGTARDSWHSRYSLAALRALWSSRVFSRDAALLVLSAKLDRDCFCVDLAMLSSESTPKIGQMTVYNKSTGEPHTWTGEIQPLSPNLPYYTEANCLKVNLSSLDLLPNSANLNLLNRELAGQSPGNVVFGRPDLNDINIVVFVRILE